jgi:plastocyanin
VTGLFAAFLLAVAAQAAPPILVIHDMAFVVPGQPLTAGETLLVRNDDIFQHSVTVKGAFDLDLKPGQSERVVLPAAGHYQVTCRYHPTMKANLVVQPRKR